ncbi:MAG: synaptic vesicle VAT-1 family membrane protein [Bradymonadia bacterium]
MSKVQIDTYGGYEQLKLIECVPQAPAPDQVQIKVFAAGINYADCIVRMGLYRSARELVGLPITPGFEVSGIVSAVGDQVTQFTVGDEVMAVTFFGGYASFITVDQAYVFSKPSDYSFIEAAGSIATFLTAHYGLVQLANPRLGEKVLIHSAAGGVGMVLVQLAHHLALEVTGVVGTSHKTEILASLGPAHIIDKQSDDLWSRARAIAPEGYDLIFDANGVSTLNQSYEHLRRPGKLVIYGFASMLPKSKGRVNWFKLARAYLQTPKFNPLTMTTMSKSVLAFNLSYLFERTDILHESMHVFNELVEKGTLKPPLCQTFPIEEVQAAHRAIESGETTGKLILTFDA